MKVVISILAAFVSQAVRAEDLIWDTTAGDGPAITYGSGTWNLTNAVWNPGSANVAWSNAPVKNALIPGTPSNVAASSIANGPTLYLQGTTVNRCFAPQVIGNQVDQAHQPADCGRWTDGACPSNIINNPHCP